MTDQDQAWFSDGGIPEDESYEDYLERLLANLETNLETNREAVDITSSAVILDNAPERTEREKLVFIPDGLTVSQEILSSPIGEAISLPPRFGRAFEELQCENIKDLLDVDEADFSRYFPPSRRTNAVKKIRRKFLETVLFPDGPSLPSEPLVDFELVFSLPEEERLAPLEENLSLSQETASALQRYGVVSIEDSAWTDASDFKRQDYAGLKNVKELRVEVASLRDWLADGGREELPTDFSYSPCSQLKGSITFDFENGFDLSVIKRNRKIDGPFPELNQARAAWFMQTKDQAQQNSMLQLGDVLNDEGADEDELRQVLDLESSLGKPVMLFRQAVSYEELVEQCIRDSWSKVTERHIKVFMLRNGIGAKKETLKRIGDSLGITRERVRQMQKEVETRLDFSKSLRFLPLRILVVSAACELGGSGSTSELVDKVSSYQLDVEGDLCQILSFVPDVTLVNDGESFYVNGVPCLTCQHLQDQAHSLESDDSAMDEASFAKAVGCSQCTSGLCAKGCFVGATTSLGACGGLVGSKKNPRIAAALHPKSKRSLIRSLLYEAERALSYEEIIALAKDRGVDVSKGQISSALEGDSGCMLWGRGAFIDGRFAPFPKNLIEGIIEFALGHMNETNVPIVHAGGLYSCYEEKLLGENVPNEQALYSLLRKLNDSRLVLREYPWVCDAEKIGDRTTFAKYFYSVLEENNGFVTDAHAESLAEKAMAPSFTLGGLSVYSPFVINANGGWYDIETAGIDMEGIASLAIEVASAMREDDIVSSEKVFEDHAARCVSYGIKSYDMLYYVINLMEDDLPLEATRKPYLVKSNREGLTAVEAIRQFIRNAPAPVSRADLFDEFVVKRKLKESLISESFVIGQDIIKTGPGLYWTASKARITDSFIENFDEQLAVGVGRSGMKAGFYYSVADVLQNCDNLVPPEGLNWTRELLEEAFSRSKRFRLFGKPGNCVVDMAKHPDIASEEGFYAELLRREFYGWAIFDEFKAYCEAAVVNASIEPEFFDAFPSIEADDICIQLIDS